MNNLTSLLSQCQRLHCLSVVSGPSAKFPSNVADSPTWSCPSLPRCVTRYTRLACFIRTYGSLVPAIGLLYGQEFRALRLSSIRVLAWRCPKYLKLGPALSLRIDPLGLGNIWGRSSGLIGATHSRTLLPIYKSATCGLIP